MGARSFSKRAPTLLLLAAALAWPVASQAEVRLVPAARGHEIRVDIRMSGQGVWAVSGPTDGYTLNPNGDLTGDGRPGASARAGRALAAWYRAVDSKLMLASGDALGWDWQAALDTGDVLGAPLAVIADEGAYVVGWTTIGEYRELQAEVALVSDSALPSMFQLPVDSMTVGAVQLADTGGVIALLADGVGGQELILAFPIKPPNEPPLLRIVSISRIDTGIDPIHEAAAVLHPTVHEVDGPDGPSAVLTWWQGDRELAFVNIGPDASVSAVETLEQPGKAVHPRSLVAKALRSSR